MKSIIPGIILNILIVCLAMIIEVLPFWPFTIDSTSPHPLDRVVLAILIGMIVNSLFSIPVHWKKGVNFSTKYFLPVAIVLMGARLDFKLILNISWYALWINLICVSFAFVLTLVLCKWFKIDQKLGILVGIGTAICGGAAIVAAAPTIEADETETSLAVTTITFFGILAIFLFPIVGHALHVDELKFGIWAGTSIQALPQVIAAAYSYGKTAGDISLLVKLTRILLLAPFVLCLSIWYNKTKCSRISKQKKNTWTSYVPPFILGFIIMMFLRTSGYLMDISVYGYTFHTQTVFSRVSSFLITMAMASIGLGTQLKGVLQTKIKVLGVGFSSAFILALISYCMINLMSDHL